MGLFQPCDRFWICSVSCGTTWNRSPTTPKSASSNIGASASLLITMMVLDVCMPARCWMAPEMPTAMYSCGDTVFPVWPTWNWCGYQPASVAERVGELLDQRKVLAAAHATAAGDHYRSLGELGPLPALLHHALDDARALRHVAGLEADGLGLGGSRRGLRCDGVRAHSHDRRPGADLGLDDDRAAEDRLLSDQVIAEVHCVGDQARTCLHRQPARDLAALGGAGDEHRQRRLVRNKASQQFRLRRDHVLAQLVAARDVHLGRTELGQPLPAAVGARAGPDDRGLAEPAGQGQQLAGDLLDRLAVVLGEDQDLSHVIGPLQPRIERSLREPRLR